MMMMSFICSCRNKKIGAELHIYLEEGTYHKSACVHGYATKLDMAKMANSVRLAICSLGVRERFDWVPTGANIADTP
jgi:hypothetical protein